MVIMANHKMGNFRFCACFCMRFSFFYFRYFPLFLRSHPLPTDSVIFRHFSMHVLLCINAPSSQWAGAQNIFTHTHIAHICTPSTACVAAVHVIKPTMRRTRQPLSLAFNNKITTESESHTAFALHTSAQLTHMQAPKILASYRNWNVFQNTFSNNR